MKFLIIFLVLGALANSCLAQDHSVCCAESTTPGYTSVVSISDTTTEDCTSHAGELYWVHTGDGYCRLLTDLACEEINLSDLGIDGSAYECDLAESSAANDVVQAYLESLDSAEDGSDYQDDVDDSESSDDYYDDSITGGNLAAAGVIGGMELAAYNDGR